MLLAIMNMSPDMFKKACVGASSMSLANISKRAGLFNMVTYPIWEALNERKN